MQELIKKLNRAVENRDAFIAVQDWNMVKTWEEQIRFIMKRIKKEIE
jgi:hypothetical protein